MQESTVTFQKPTPKQIWDAFKTSFQKNVAAAGQSRLKSVSGRKYFFKEVFEVMAKDLGYEYNSQEEFLRVDYTFFKPGKLNGWSVPMIAIESENCWDTCDKEASKLCSINAPLKVLITYGYPEGRKKEMEANDTYWNYIFEDFIHETQLVGWYAVIIYDDTKDSGISFKTFVYNEKGEREINEHEDIVILN